MIFCNACSNCIEGKKIDMDECDKARNYWKKYNACYIFECGAVYNPYGHGADIRPSNKCKHRVII